MENFQNINEFRTYIIQKYHSFPTRVISTMNVSSAKKNTEGGDEEKAAKEIQALNLE